LLLLDINFSYWFWVLLQTRAKGHSCLSGAPARFALPIPRKDGSAGLRRASAVCPSLVQDGWQLGIQGYIWIADRKTQANTGNRQRPTRDLFYLGLGQLPRAFPREHPVVMVRRRFFLSMARQLLVQHEVWTADRAGWKIGGNRNKPRARYLFYLGLGQLVSTFPDEHPVIIIRHSFSFQLHAPAIGPGYRLDC
jgi:hypothetical protein